ncbi:MAG: hypothetical protein OEV94_00700 [Deltaproteobacteria bacterium]|nr:hypothetical protein [Deltaproteobacteria bacterium]
MTLKRFRWMAVAVLMVAAGLLPAGLLLADCQKDLTGWPVMLEGLKAPHHGKSAETITVSGRVSGQAVKVRVGIHDHKRDVFHPAAETTAKNGEFTVKIPLAGVAAGRHHFWVEVEDAQGRVSRYAYVKAVAVFKYAVQAREGKTTRPAADSCIGLDHIEVD